MIIAKVKTLNAGYQSERDHVVNKGWQVGDEFEVLKISVGGWSSEVALECDKTGYTYNSCFFDFFEDGRSLDIYRDSRFASWNIFRS